MKKGGFIPWLVVLACLVSAGCSLSRNEAVMPLTTSSEEASRLYREGMGLLELSRAGEARARFEQAVELDPEFAVAHLGLAETAPSLTGLYASLRKAAALKGQVSEGERRMILALEAGTRGNPVKQSEHQQALVSLYPEDKGALARYGAFLISKGQYKRALDNLEGAVALDPDYPWPYALMGAAHRGQGDFQLAREAIDRYLGLLPDEPAAHIALADLLMKQGNFQESNRSYEKAIALDPAVVSAYVGVGNNYIFMGEFERARETFGKVADVAVSDADRLLGPLWSALSFVHEGRHDDALAELERRQEMARRTEDVSLIYEGLLRMGDVLMDGGRFDDALDRYTGAHAAIKRGGLPWVAIGAAGLENIYRQIRVEFARGDLPAARAALRGFLRQVARQKDQLWTKRRVELRGMLALAEGDMKKATMMLPRADEGNARILYLGALARRRAGDDEGARNLCRRAAEFNEVDLEYAFVRTPARKMLEEL